MVSRLCKILLCLAALITCVAAMPANTVPSEKDYFAGAKGCFLLYNLKTQTYEKVIGDARCRERFVPCSTFKVPLAIMGFDSGVLKDENEVYKWDGSKGVIPEHEHDHTAKTWLRDSVVWYSQRLTPKLGKEKIEKYLKGFRYGNADMSGGITEAWLVSPASPAAAVKVSAYEQAEFMKNLWTDKLPVSKRAMQLTRDITYLETSPKGYKLSGKTGSNFYDELRGQPLRTGFGWFIAHLQKDGQAYIAVTNLSDVTPTDAKSFGGRRAKQIAKDILADLNLW